LQGLSLLWLNLQATFSCELPAALGEFARDGLERQLASGLKIAMVAIVVSAIFIVLVSPLPEMASTNPKGILFAAMVMTEVISAASGVMVATSALRAHLTIPITLDFRAVLCSRQC
jgi:hypothetical protein